MLKKILCWVLICQHINVYALHAEITLSYPIHDEIYLHASQGSKGTTRLSLGTDTDNEDTPQKLLGIIEIPSYKTLSKRSHPVRNERGGCVKPKPTVFESAGIKRFPDRIQFALQGLNISINNEGDLTVEGRQTDFRRPIFLSSTRTVTLQNLEAHELHITAPSFHHTGTSSINLLVLEGVISGKSDTPAPFANTGTLNTRECFLRNLKAENSGDLNISRFSLMGDLLSSGSFTSRESILESNALLKFTDTSRGNINSLTLNSASRFENYSPSAVKIDRLGGIGGTFANYGTLLVHEMEAENAFDAILNQGLFHVETGNVNTRYLENTDALTLTQGTLSVEQGHNAGGLQVPSLSIGNVFTNTRGVSTAHLKGTGTFHNRGILENVLEDQEDMTLDIHQIINEAFMRGHSLTGTQTLMRFTNTKTARTDVSHSLAFSPTTTIDNEGSLKADDIMLSGPFTLQKGDITSRWLHLTGETFVNQEDGDIHVDSLTGEEIQHLTNNGFIFSSTFSPESGVLQTLENSVGATLEVGPLDLHSVSVTNEGDLRAKGLTFTEGALIQRGNLNADFLKLNGNATVTTTNEQEIVLTGTLESQATTPWDIRGTITTPNFTHLGITNLFGKLTVHESCFLKGILHQGSLLTTKGLKFSDSLSILGHVAATSLTARNASLAIAKDVKLLGLESLHLHSTTATNNGQVQASLCELTGGAFVNTEGSVLKTGTLNSHGTFLKNNGLVSATDVSFTDGSLAQEGTLKADSLKLNGGATVTTMDGQEMGLTAALDSQATTPWDIRGTITTPKFTHSGITNLFGALTAHESCVLQGKLHPGGKLTTKTLEFCGPTEVAREIVADSLTTRHALTLKGTARIRDRVTVEDSFTVGDQGTLQGYPDHVLSVRLGGRTEIAGTLDVDDLETDQDISVRPNGILLSRGKTKLRSNLTIDPTANAELYGLRVNKSKDEVSSALSTVTLAIQNYERLVSREFLETIPSTVLLLKRNGNRASTEEMVVYLLQQYNTEAWSTLTPKDQTALVSKIQTGIFSRELRETIPSTVLSLKKSGNKASLKEIIVFLLRQHNAEAWDTLTPEDQIALVSKIQRGIFSRAFMETIPSTVLLLKKNGNRASTEEMIRFLLRQHNTEAWDTLTPEDQTALVSKIQTKSLIESLSTQLPLIEFIEKIPSTVLSLKKSGNKDSTEEIIRFLLRGHNTETWDTLVPEDQKTLVSKVQTELFSRELRETIPSTILSLKKSGNKASLKEIIVFLLRQQNTEAWSTLTPEDQNSLVSKIQTKVLIESLSTQPPLIEFIEKILSTVLSLKKSGNMASIKDRIIFLLRQHNTEAWSTLTPKDQTALVSKVQTELFSRALMETIPSTVLSLKKSGNTASTKEIIIFLLRQHNMEAWDTLLPEDQNSLVSKIQTRALIESLSPQLPLIENRGIASLFISEEGAGLLQLHNYGKAQIDALQSMAPSLSSILPVCIRNHPQAQLTLTGGSFDVSLKGGFDNRGAVTLENAILWFAPLNPAKLWAQPNTGGVIRNYAGLAMGNLHVAGELTVYTALDALKALEGFTTTSASKVIVQAPHVQNTLTDITLPLQNRPIKEYPWPLELRLSGVFDNAFTLQSPELTIVSQRLKTSGYLFSLKSILSLEARDDMDISAPVSGLKGVNEKAKKLRIFGRKSIPGTVAPNHCYERNNNGFYSTEGPIILTMSEFIDNHFGTLSGTSYSLTSPLLINRAGLISASDPASHSEIRVSHIQNIREDQGAYSITVPCPNHYRGRRVWRCNVHHCDNCPGWTCGTRNEIRTFETSPEGIIAAQGSLRLAYDQLDMIASRISCGGNLTLGADGRTLTATAAGDVAPHTLPGRTTMPARNGHANHVLVKGNLAARLGVADMTSSFTAANFSMRALHLTLQSLGVQQHQQGKIIDLLQRASQSGLSQQRGGTQDLILPSSHRDLPSTLVVLGKGAAHHVRTAKLIDTQMTMRLCEQVVGEQFFTLYKDVRALGFNMHDFSNTVANHVRRLKNTQVFTFPVKSGETTKECQLLVNTDTTGEDLIHSGIVGLFMEFSHHLTAVSSEVSAEQAIKQAQQTARLKLSIPAGQPNGLKATAKDADIRTTGDCIVRTSIEALHDVTVGSEQGKMTVESTVRRHYVGENFTDILDPVTIKGGNSVLIEGPMGLELRAIDTHSGAGGTQLISGNGAVVNKSVPTVSENVSYHRSKRSSTITKRTDIHQNVSHHRTEGGVTVFADCLIHQEGGFIENGRMYAPRIMQSDVHDQHSLQIQTTSHKKKKGLGGWVGMKEHKTTTSQTIGAHSKGIRTAGRTFMVLAESYKAINPTYEAECTDITAPKVTILPGINQVHSVRQSFSKNLVWVRQRHTQEEHTTHNNPTFEGETFIHSADGSIGRVKGTKLSDHLHSDTPLQFTDVADSHHSVTKTQTSLTPPMIIAVGAGVSTLTAGLAAPLAGSVAATFAVGAQTAAIITTALDALVTTAAVQGATSLAANGGNLSDTFKSFGTKETVQALVTSVITAGLTKGFEDYLKVLPKGAERTAVQASVATILTGMTNPDNMGQAALQGITTAVASAVGAKCANTIGDWMNPMEVLVDGKTVELPAQIGALEGYAMHVGVGALLGAASNYREAGSGAGGGAMAALLTKVGMAGLQGPLSPEVAGNVAIIGSTLLTALATGDVTATNAAALTATNVVVNNDAAHDQMGERRLPGTISQEDMKQLFLSFRQQQLL